MIPTATRDQFEAMPKKEQVWYLIQRLLGMLEASAKRALEEVPEKVLDTMDPLLMLRAALDLMTMRADANYRNKLSPEAYKYIAESRMNYEKFISNIKNPEPPKEP